jgi:hypothetical protein
MACLVCWSFFGARARFRGKVWFAGLRTVVPDDDADVPIMSSGDEIGNSTVLPQMQWHFRNFHLQSRGIAPKKAAQFRQESV